MKDVSEDMKESQVLARRNLSQLNATIIAGMLIFLTINDLIPDEPIKSVIVISTISGFSFLVTLIGLCIVNTKHQVMFSDEQMMKRFDYAKSLFFAGIFLLFVTVALVLISRFYFNN